MLWLDEATFSSAFLFFANPMRACPSAVGWYFLLTMLRLLSSSVDGSTPPGRDPKGQAGHPRLRAAGQLGQVGQAGGAGQHFSTGDGAGVGAGVGGTGQAGNLGKSVTSIVGLISFSGNANF